LDKIAIINRQLGGNKVTLQGIEILLDRVPETQEITIIDIGCGNGDMLRTIADYGIKHNRRFKLTGIDANQFAIDYARSLSGDYANIDYLCQDIFDNILTEINYDIALCTLTLHHFTDSEVLKIMADVHQQAKVGVVINDLQRSKFAYKLFQFVCYIFNINKMPKNDGLLSILKGFKRNELVAYSKKLNFTNYTIRWKWAFRYQWIISKL
jgi:2-polyprenyl-3-methyl-5-hydroxy-6-metoxy-1,4-benzoquinol methylase